MQSLFNVIVKSTTTTEKRLMIDIHAVREAYDWREVGNVGWIKSIDNLADGLTELAICQALTKFMDMGILKTRVGQWIMRSEVMEPK